MFNIKQSPGLTYLFAFAAAVFFAVDLLNVLTPQVELWIWGLLGLVNFGSVAAVRAFLDTQGWRTYAIVILGTVGIVAIATGMIDVETLRVWLNAWGILPLDAANTVTPANLIAGMIVGVNTLAPATIARAVHQKKLRD